jgi:hypothetical protein
MTGTDPGQRTWHFAVDEVTPRQVTVSVRIVPPIVDIYSATTNIT